MRRIAFIIMGMVLVLLVGTGTQSLAQEGVIHACVRNRDGKIRIVEDDSQCHPNKETHLSWNQMGEPGPTGPPGANGEPGQPGPQGPPGMGYLGVYDGNDLFLGYLISFSKGRGFTVYDPSVSGMFDVNVFQDNIQPYVRPSTAGYERLNWFFFTSEEGCMGQAYADLGKNSALGSFKDFYENYYMIDSTVTPVTSDEINHCIMPGVDLCQPYEEYPYQDIAPDLFFPVRMFNVPETLEYPIVVRPVE